MSEVDDNFAAALDTAFSLDAVTKTFAFSDGSGAPPDSLSGAGKIFVSMQCLWISDWERIVRTHSHGTNYVLSNNAITAVFFASDVPGNARIAANAYVDVDGVQYRIDSAVLENGIYEIDLQVFRSR